MIFIDDYCEALRREKETALELQTEALVTLETMVVGDGIVSCPYLPLYILFQDVSSFHSTFLQTRQCNGFNGLNEGGLSALAVEYAPFESF